MTPLLEKWKKRAYMSRHMFTKRAKQVEFLENKIEILEALMKNYECQHCGTKADWGDLKLEDK